MPLCRRSTRTILSREFTATERRRYNVTPASRITLAFLKLRGTTQIHTHVTVERLKRAYDGLQM